MNGFICPVCKKTLVRDEKKYTCGNNHSYDIAAKGYVNLLLSNQMNAKLPGDNKLMVAARTQFLNNGYYSHLADEICNTVGKYFHGGLILDAGCGEGYYTEKIYRSLELRSDDFRLLGIDISKFACAAAAKRFKADKGCEIGVASIFHMPICDESADCVVTMFAPFCREEFVRVAKKNGILIMAIPAQNHLMSLKKAIYDEPYQNQTADYEIEGFEFIQTRKISRTVLIENSDDIKSLFSMTPYYYKTGIEGHERVNALQTLETEAEFEVLVYRRK